ncbi:hypothetical protein SAMN05444287_3068 [Octadecabacter temperatus]|uniref:Uncharacterized protein n=1 Tax=Octadecabacter temperatus TaxID=1458307 RepID=A0A0K0Y8U8_9RHOB|nr:hypothetical protein [Octadecabacter temperatus]AKS47292.1 hypothetical protein OSB_27680 [Octadecabacter temperatus]SIO44355.1 hypothetical protein SAMN05444287_3068 [Octadecabacter temperatus]
MRITTDTPDLLILRFTRWKASLFFTVLTGLGLWGGVKLAYNPDAGLFALLLWLFLTVLWTTLFALTFMERSMLVLNAQTGEADFRHATAIGLHRHKWPLSEVQSTRVTRRRTDGPAIDDPKRLMTLYVREGMDEGRHKLTNGAMPAEDVLAASARVSDWMKDWRANRQKPDDGSSHANRSAELSEKTST